jgi:hypothetical protein
MARDRRAGRWASLLTVCLLLVVAPATIYYLAYAQRQEAYFTGRNFRVLSLLGEQLGAQRAALKGVLRFFYRDPLQDVQYRSKASAADQADTDQQLAAQQFEQAKWNLVAAGPQASLPRLEREVQESEALLQRATAAATKARNERDGIAAALGSTQWAPGFRHLRVYLPKALCNKIDTSNAQFVLEQDTVEIRYSACDPASDARATIPLADLVASELALPVFDAVLLADGDGRIVHPRPGEGGPLASGLREVKERVDAGEEKPRQIDRVPTHAVVFEKTLLGVPYKLFVLPVAPPFDRVEPSNQADAAWFVIGLVPKERFDSEVRSIPPPILYGVVIGMLLGLLAWPLLKLWYSNPEERTRRRDGLLIATSLLMGVAILSLVVTDFLARAGVREERDRQLENVSRTMRAAFREELAGTLDTLCTEFARLRPTAVSPTSKDADVREFRDANELLAWRHGERPALDGRYPPFEIVFGLDSRGIQHGTIRSYRSAPVKPEFEVPERAYFSRVLGGDVWRLHDARTAGCSESTPFSIERVRVYDQGVPLTAISMAATQALNPDASFRVAVLIGRMHSLWSPPLPRGFHFAVIEDASGRVLYHSEDARSLRENWFEETDHNDELFAAVQARRERLVSGRYLGAPARFHSAPIQDLEWSLVVFDGEAARYALGFELIVTSLAHLLLYGAILVAGIAVLSRLRPEMSWSWIWPSSTFADRYRSCLAPALMALALGIFGLMQLAGLSLALLLVSLPGALLGVLFLVVSMPPAYDRSSVPFVGALAIAGGAAVAIALLGLAGGGVPPAPSLLLGMLLYAATLTASLRAYRLARDAPVAEMPNSHWKSSYVALLLLFLLVAGALPAAGIYLDTFRFEMEKVTKLARLQYVEALQEREREVRDDVMRLNPGEAALFAPGWRETLRSVEGLHCVGIHCWSVPWAPTFEGPRLGIDTALIDRGPRASGGAVASPEAEELDVRPRAFTAWLALSLPALDRGFGEARYVAFDRASDDRWASVPLRAGEIRIEGAVTDEHGNMYALRLPAAPPGVQPIESRTAQLLLAVIAASVLLALYLIVRAVARRLLGLEVPELVDLPRESEVGRWRNTSAELVRAPREVVDELARVLRDDDGLEVDRTDLQAASPAELSRWMVRHRDSAKRAFVLEGIDALLDAPESRRRLLSTLESVLREPASRVFLGVEQPLAETLDVLLQAGGDPVREHEARTELTRWSRVLPHFAQRCFAEADWKRIPSVREATLARECGWSERLRPIGEALACCGEIDQLSPAQIRQEVRARATPFYRWIWSRCSQREKMILIQLSEGTLADPKTSDALDRLVRRGLVKRDPGYRLVSESFTEFVQRAEAPQTVRRWEAAVSNSDWSVLKIPLGLVILGFAAFILYSGQDAVQKSLAVIPVLAGAVPTVLGLFNALRGSHASGGEG